MSRRINIIIGKQYNYLLVDACLGKDKSGHYIYDCTCTHCGKEHVVALGSSLASGHKKSCGCIHSKSKPYTPLAGRKYGLLVVLRDYKSTNEHGVTRHTVDCLCTGCGSEITIFDASDNKLKGVYSCGCSTSKGSNPVITHGMSKTRFYVLWTSMKRRCYNPNSLDYVDYGGRGIAVCDRWKDSFENFRDDMYESYLKHVEEFGEKDTTIDRIDVDGNYELSNCRWATWQEQFNNKRDSKYVTYKGETHTISQWERILGISRGSLWNRLIHLNYSIEDAFETAKYCTRGNRKDDSNTGVGSSGK